MNYYYTGINNEPIGPVEEKQLRQLYIDGRVEGNAWAIAEDGKEWQPLLSLLTGQPKPPPSLPPPPPPHPSTLRSSSQPFRSPTKMAEAIRLAKKLREEFTPLSPKPVKAAQTQYPAKPRVIYLIAILSLASGVANIFWGLSLIGLGLHIFLIGVIFTIIPALCCLFLGFFNIIYGIKLFFSMPTPPAKNLAACDVASIIFLNLIACVFGIINLALYKEETVVQYFNSHLSNAKKI